MKSARMFLAPTLAYDVLLEDELRERLLTAFLQLKCTPMVDFHDPCNKPSLTKLRSSPTIST